jgi:NTP pyrophosphatase (non-canonical NTP hydrolase)
MLKGLMKAVAKREGQFSKGADVPLSFRGNELAGETGELCNDIKKLERLRLGMVGGKDTTENLKDEIGDVIICVCLIAMQLNIDLEEAVISKFNKTSDKHGLTVKI